MTPSGIIFCLCILLLVSIFINLVLWDNFQKNEKMLLDRLMARDFGEYKLFQQSTIKRKVHPSMTDAREAEIEAQRKEALNGV